MKHSLVRNTIVETAAELFYLNGYNLTGINEIIKEAGIAKATLYNHFKSKEDVCVAYLKYRDEHFCQNLTEFVESKVGKSKVLGLFDFLSNFFEEDRFNGCWCLNTSAELPRDNKLINDEILKQKLNFIRFIEGLIQEYRKDDRTQSLAKKVYLIYEASITESNLHKDKWPIEEGRKLCALILE